MAFYTKFKLPPLKVTESTQGSSSSYLLFQGSCSRERCEEVVGTGTDAHSDSDSEVGVPHLSDCIASSQDYDEPTTHELERQSSVSKWEQLRRNLLSVRTECAALPLNQLCVTCPNVAEVRCLECGPGIYYCKGCFCKQHECVNLFHVAEKWEDDHFSVCNFGPRIVNVVRPHACSARTQVTLQCIDDKGMEHVLLFTSCSCEPLPLTLVRANLWPSSPQYPKLVFTFKLLDWVEALMLECQVPLKDFCKALYFRCPYILKKRRDVYRALIDAFEEYRFYKHELRHLHFLSDSLDAGNVCPACPKDDGKVVLSIDGLFGLPRKKAAGTSYRSAVHGGLFFCDQLQVDEFVKDSAGTRTVSMDCNEFLAGNMLRSATRFHRLDETAVFGSVCRHDFPSLFLNLKHGERLAYADFLIDSLLEKYASHNVYIMYDIACILQKHWKLNGRDDVLDNVHLCLPSFHSFGHKASCQMKYGPLRCEGVGLSDGEGMERLWSFLRRFGRMTKEMRPAHRIDVLSHALVYYGIQKNRKLGHSLVMRWKRAKDINYVARETYLKLLSCQEGSVSEKVICQWVDEEKSMEQASKSGFSTLPQWKCEYFMLLHPFLHWSEKVREGTLQADERLTALHELTRLDKLLKEVETKHKVTCRWSVQDKEYTYIYRMFTKERMMEIGKALWTASTTRQFLLKLKAKYADGQKIAKKLSLQITKETKNIKSLLPEYNACCLSTVDSEDGARLDIKEALDPNELTVRIQPGFTLAAGAKRELIDSYILMKRSSEEVGSLRSEMKNTLLYYTSKREHLVKALQPYAQLSDDFSRGATGLLNKMRHEVEEQITSFEDLFSIRDSHSCLTDGDDESDDYESDTDTESEDD